MINFNLANILSNFAENLIIHKHIFMFDYPICIAIHSHLTLTRIYVNVLLIISFQIWINFSWQVDGQKIRRSSIYYVCIIWHITMLMESMRMGGIYKFHGNHQFNNVYIYIYHHPLISYTTSYSTILPLQTTKILKIITMFQTL